MDPTNPIKESHKAELEWLFRDLGLLSRTVFVLSRFDAVLIWKMISPTVPRWR